MRAAKIAVEIRFVVAYWPRSRAGCGGVRGGQEAAPLSTPASLLASTTFRGAGRTVPEPVSPSADRTARPRRRSYSDVVSEHAPDTARVVPFAPARSMPPQQAPSAERAAPSGPTARQERLWRDVIGGVLRRERHAQRRTLRDVADAARISLPYLSELERGRKEASSEVLAAAARALSLTLADLLALAHRELHRPAPEEEKEEAARGTSVLCVTSRPPQRSALPGGRTDRTGRGAPDGVLLAA